MKHVALNTISAFSVLFIPVMAFFIFFIYRLADISTYEGLSEGAYYHGVMSMVILYFVLLMFPTGFNLIWEAFKEKKKFRIVFLVLYIVFVAFSVQVLMNGLLVISFVLTVLLANKWMDRYSVKTKLIMACIPVIVISGYSVIALSVA
jgi:hypothetical protein